MSTPISARTGEWQSACLRQSIGRTSRLRPLAGPLLLVPVMIYQMAVHDSEVFGIRTHRFCTFLQLMWLGWWSCSLVAFGLIHIVLLGITLSMSSNHLWIWNHGLRLRWSLGLCLWSFGLQQQQNLRHVHPPAYAEFSPVTPSMSRIECCSTTFQASQTRPTTMSRRFTSDTPPYSTGRSRGASLSCHSRGIPIGKVRYIVFSGIHNLVVQMPNVILRGITIGNMRRIRRGFAETRQRRNSTI